MRETEYNGRKVEEYTATDEGLGERLVLLADPETELPVKVELYSGYGGKWELAGETERIEYNVPIEEARFAFTAPPGTQTVDKDQLVAEWKQRYYRGLQRVNVNGQEVVLRDFQVTTTGDVYAVWTGFGIITGHCNPKDLPAGWEPTRWETTLTDSLGTVYLGGGRFWVRQDPSDAFCPLTPPAHQPQWYELTIECKGQTFAFKVTQPNYSPLPDPVFPDFRTKAGWLDYWHPQGPGAIIEDAEARAYYWEKQNGLPQALEQWELAMTTSDRNYHRRYFEPSEWGHLGDLYLKVGATDKARYAYERGIESGSLGDREKRCAKTIDDAKRALERLK